MLLRCNLGPFASHSSYLVFLPSCPSSWVGCVMLMFIKIFSSESFPFLADREWERYECDLAEIRMQLDLYPFRSYSGAELLQILVIPGTVKAELVGVEGFHPFLFHRFYNLAKFCKKRIARCFVFQLPLKKFGHCH